MDVNPGEELNTTTILTTADKSFEFYKKLVEQRGETPELNELFFKYAEKAKGNQQEDSPVQDEDINED